MYSSKRDEGGPSMRDVMALDVEQQEPFLSGPPKRLWNRVNVAILSCMGAVLVFLIIMAAVFTGKDNHAAAPAPAFTVPPGGIAACFDDEALCLIAKPVSSPDQDYRGHPRKVNGSQGVVAADQSRCADIGARVLEENGTAADAAVAVTLCQGVVNPFASGVGGGFFALLRDANGSAEFLNAREVAPAAASFDMYNGTSADSSLYGGLAIAVPLELKGLELMWRQHGRLPWQRLVEPAAKIARHGFAAHPYLVYCITGPRTLPRLQADPLARAAFLVRDPRNATVPWRAPAVGELCCRRPALADTLDAVGANGVAWLYEPSRVQAMAAEIKAAGGIITEQDLHEAEPSITPPLSYTLPGPVPYQLLVPPPPSSGAVLYLALALVLGFNTTSLPDLPQPLLAHRMVESMKHAFAVRSALGDPGSRALPFTNVEAVLQDITNASFVDELRSRINDSAVLPLSEYGGRWNPLSTGVSPDDHGTSHVSILDKYGNAVSLTTTINTVFGSFVISKSTGILFNNEMDDFSRPDRPNKYNLSAAVPNYIQPRKRPLSSMSPALVLQPGGGAGGAGGAMKLVVGASNGPRIITGILQSIIRLLYLGQDPLAAVSGSRLHNQWIPDTCLYENYTLNGVTFMPDGDVISNLTAKADVMLEYHDQLGDVQAILLDTANGVATAVSDPRKDGAAAAARAA